MKLAEAKAEDALLLLQHGRYSNAYYLAGYAVEIGLKAIIASEFESDTLPDKNFVTKIYVHELTKLVGFAGLEAELKQLRRANFEFGTNWAIMANWSEDARYEPVDSIRASSMVEAILNEKNGILPWLRTHW